jgi:hypothetical protein
MKNILVVLDNIPKFNIEVSPKNKISDIKFALENYFDQNQLSINNYILDFYIDSKNKMPVFFTNKYDSLTLEKVFKSMDNPRITINKKTVFTGIKDVDLIILGNLNDEDLLNTCKIKNNYLRKICNNEDFWRNRFIKNFGNTVEKLKERTWKNFYVSIVYYSNEYFPREILEEVSKGGMKNIDLINYFILIFPWAFEFAMFGAAEGGDLNLVKIFIKKGAKIWDGGLFSAAKGGHKDLVKFFQEQINDLSENKR